MSQPPKGRGRARGRAFAQQQQQSQPAVRRPTQQESQAAAAAAPSPQQFQPPPPVQQEPMRAVAQQMAAVALERGEPRGAVGGNRNNGNGSNGVRGRGAYRGRREELVTRPHHISDKRGESGQQVAVVANYFRLISLPQFVIYQYHVDFNPIVESSRIRSALLRDHRDKFSAAYLFDGMSDLKTTTKLPDEVTEFFSKRQTDDATIRITLKRTRELAPTDPELLRLFNSQMRRNMRHLQYQLINRNYFNPRDKLAIPQHGLELWPGVLTAVRQHETSVMLVVDLVHKVMRTETVLDLISSIRQRSQDYRQMCLQKIVGSIVMTNYNNNTYRIDDIEWGKNPTDTFDFKGTPLTYIDYYKRQYDIQIRDHTQPLLVCRPSVRDRRGGRMFNIHLIPEICVMTGLTDEMRADFNIMKDLAQHTRVNPQKRVQNLNNFIRDVTQHPKIREEMNAWGLQFENKLVDIQSRLVMGETVFMRDKRIDYKRQTADFAREMREFPMHVALEMKSWCLFCPRKEQQKATDFIHNLLRVCPPMGMRVAQPNCVYLQDDRVGTYISTFKDCYYRFRPQMCIFIVPNNKRERYDAIKKITCVDIPVHSQVIVARTLAKKQMLMSVATKIGIQLNCKLGGEAWWVEIPLKNLLVVGFDTYHDSRQRDLSAGGLVASMNRTLTRWYSQVAFHSTHQELSDKLVVQFSNALKKYQKVKGTLPDHIVFYRDGVSEGQIPHVIEWELNQILESFRKTAPDYTPKIAFVIVTKRISTRFFAVANGGRFENPLPGTVVDTEVTRPEWYDFFLVSQSVRQGTVSPTQYNVIYDTTGLKPEHIQRLTYKLTHLYYNWAGTIRVPAPCQYAHKLAFLSGQNIHAPPSEDLADTLFYL